MKKNTMLISVMLTIVLALGVGEVVDTSDVSAAKSDSTIMMQQDPNVDGVG